MITECENSEYEVQVIAEAIKIARREGYLRCVEDAAKVAHEQLSDDWNREHYVVSLIRALANGPTT